MPALIHLPREAKELYEKGKSIPEISVLLSFKLSTVRLGLIRMGVVLRSRKEGMKLAGWKITAKLKGGKHKPRSKEARQKISAARLRHSSLYAKGVSLKPSGYLEFTKGPNKGRFVHTVIIEGIIGRRITKNEAIHHKDRNKQNNHPDNLQLMTQSEHAKLHRREDKICRRITA